MKQRVTFITILIILGIVLLSFLPSLFFERWSNAVEGGGSGRLGIWYFGLLSLEKYWPFGAGLKNFPLAFAEFAPYAGATRAPHNIYLGYFVELGIIGFSLLIMAIISHYKVIRSSLSFNNINQIMLTASLCGTLVASCFLDTLYVKSFWLLWMMIMMNKNIFEGERIACGNY